MLSPERIGPCESHVTVLSDVSPERRTAGASFPVCFPGKATARSVLRASGAFQLMRQQKGP